MNDCRTCLGPCDPEIHEATLAVRAWFREQVIIAPPQPKPAKHAHPLVPLSGAGLGEALKKRKEVTNEN